MAVEIEKNCLIRIFLVIFLSFGFGIIFAAQTNYNYVSKENTWQANEASHTKIDLMLESTNVDLQRSQCAFYCTSTDNKFEYVFFL